MFSPLAFPDGRIMYSLSLSANPALSVECFPFELNREAQVILYLADGSDLVYPKRQPELQQEKGSDVSPEGSQDESKNVWGLDSLEDEVRVGRSQYRRAILHQLLIFDSVVAAESSSIPTDVLLVPPTAKSRTTTIKTVMCDITARLLHSMDDFAHEIQDLSTIESPSSAPSSKYTATDVAAKVHARMSMPEKSTQGSLELAGSRNPATGSSVSRSATPVGARSTSRHSVATPNRGDRFSETSSAFGSRDVSRDRNSMAPQTVTTPTERKKNRSIARGRIVVGALYLQAGLWPDALKDLSEGTALARSNNDYVWHAKGLEYIIACLFMFGCAKLYFQVRTDDPTR
jgi:trafficking protein particle complex subunit 9